MATSSPETRVALITGAARRVGRAVALELANAGFDIAFTYLHSSQGAADLAREIEGKSRRCMAIAADLCDPANAVEAIYQSLVKTFNRLDVLMNNASLYETDNLQDHDQARRLWAIHVESPLMLARRFSPMLSAAGGAIINMVDIMVERPMLGYVAYCASKAGLWNLTLSLARELAPKIRVNGIAPGVVEWAVGASEEDRAKYLRRVPLARAGTPQDVAAAARFLCTSGSYITGQILRLDGGRSIT